MMAVTQQDPALELIRQLGVIRAADLVEHGIGRRQLYRLVQAGLIERETRGVYFAKDHELTENHSLAVVAKRVPNAVVCLLSALRFHDIGTQSEHRVWITLPEKARLPRFDYPPIQVTRASGVALTSGIETHRVEGVDVRIYSAAKTVVDCFKYRNRYGLDVALEAMWEGWRNRRYTMDEIFRFARICRVERVMRPYLEAMVA